MVVARAELLREVKETYLAPQIVSLSVSHHGAPGLSKSNKYLNNVGLKELQIVAYPKFLVLPFGWFEKEEVRKPHEDLRSVWK